MRNIKLNIFIVFLSWVVSINHLKAQNDVSIHLMPIIPQSIYSNPSFSPQANIYIGFPGFSSVYFGLSHSGFNYRDLVKKRSDDSLYLDVDNMIRKMGKRNFLSVNYNHELLAFGFRVKKNYFSVSATEKISTKFSYPKDLFSLFWKGNTWFLGKETDLGVGLNMTHYREIALGMNREISDKLTLGLRAKVLFGMSNLWTEKSDITLTTDPNTYDLTARSHIIINASFPEAFKDDSLDFNFSDYISNTSNMGFAFDVGGTYKINDKFTVAASVLDIGKISWKTGVNNFVSEDASFTFEGIDLNDFFGQDSTDTVDGVDILVDSLSKIFEIKETNNSYSNWLPGIVYITGIYNLTGKSNVGLMARGDIFNSTIQPSLTLSYNTHFFNWLSASLTYSILNRSYLNLGFGMALQVPGFQFYILSDNFYGLIRPTSSRNATVHFGINLPFKYKVKPPEAPLIN